MRRGRLERTACERLGLPVEAATEPDESWLDGLDEALDELPAGQLEAIRLRVVDELEYDDVARELGTSTEAARVRVHRGLQHAPPPPPTTNGDPMTTSPDPRLTGSATISSTPAPPISRADGIALRVTRRWCSSPRSSRPCSAPPPRSRPTSSRQTTSPGACLPEPRR